MPFVEVDYADGRQGIHLTGDRRHRGGQDDGDQQADDAGGHVLEYE